MSETLTNWRDQEWNIPKAIDGKITWQGVELALLNDIRRELRRIRAIAECPNAIDIPRILRRIEANTKKRKRKHDNRTSNRARRRRAR